MSVELVGLAYDQSQADAVWNEKTILESYRLVLDDEFRRKVDYRSMLYHKGQLDLLTEFESLLRQGGERLTLIGLEGARFFAGFEGPPGGVADLTLDYQLIRYFASLAMADDFLVADPFLRELLAKIGFLKGAKTWSLLQVKDFIGLSDALREVRMQDILEASRKVSLLSGSISLENLVRNYIEFLSYTRNNGLTPFFYNSQSAMKQWGNLVDRKNGRSELIVDHSMKPFRRPRPAPAPKKAPASKSPVKESFAEKVKRRRERDALLGGLTDLDPLIRQKSAESLGKFADPDIVDPLIARLADPEPEVRHEVVRSLGKTPGAKADDRLLDALANDESFSVRLTAAHALQNRKVKQSLGVLLDLVEQGQPHFSTLLAYHPLLAKDAVSQKRLLKMGQSAQPEVRREVAFILGRSPAKAAEAALEKLSQDEDAQASANALYSLWDLRSKKTKKIAKQLAGHPSEIVARAAGIVHPWCDRKA